MAPDVEPKSATSFEQQLENLERVVDKLERGELSLEEAIELYESGYRSLKRCYSILDEARARIEVLTASFGQSPPGAPMDAAPPRAAGGMQPLWRPADLPRPPVEETGTLPPDPEE